MIKRVCVKALFSLIHCLHFNYLSLHIISLGEEFSLQGEGRRSLRVQASVCIAHLSSAEVDRGLLLQLLRHFS